ncbi:MAG TPA: hypothetical protein VGQ57_16060 [Polyangiaceae bacterium]|jgi:hypothetical protein|nr:hypothetical protein [Polyangiaceae bacterium]
MMISIQRSAALAAVLLLNACAAGEPGANSAAQAQSGAFVYAPALNKPLRETMTRYEEVSIPGSPMRDAQQWTLDFDVVTTQESNLFKRSHRLVGLKINVNGAEQLKGDEVKGDMATVDVLTDKDSNVVDVRGTDQLSNAIAGLGTPEAQPLLKQIFSPQRLKALIILRSIEQHADFVGRPATVGSQWQATEQDSGVVRQIRVAGETPCDTTKCVQVQRTYELDRQAVFAEVADRVAAYVKAQGGDPNKVQLVSMDMKLEDSMTIDPATMEYHGARLSEDATLHVAGPNGELPVAFKVVRERHYKY